MIAELINPGIVALIVFALMIIFFIVNHPRFPMPVVSVAGCLLCVLLGISTLPKAMTGFSHDIVFLVIGMDVASQALLKVGVADLIGRAIMKASQDNEKRLMIVSFLAASLIGWVLNNMTTIMIFLVIFHSIVKVTGNIYMKNITLPMIAGAMIGGGCTLIGTTPNLVGHQILLSNGLQGFKMFDFTPIGITLTVVIGLMIYFFSYERGKKIWPKDLVKADKPDATIEKVTEQIKSEIITEVKDKKKLYTMAAIMVILITLLVSTIVSLGTAAIFAAVLCILTGCITHREAFSGMNWGLIIWLAGCFSITEILNATGGAKLIATTAINSIPGDVTPFVFFALMTLACMCVSQVVSDTVCVLVFLPVFLPVALELGVSPQAVAMGVIYAANLSYLTPLASAQIGIALSIGHDFKEIFRYGWLLHIVMYITIIIVIPLVFPLTV